jgi:thiol-disulfide isomerase/thioredoxin
MSMLARLAIAILFTTTLAWAQHPEDAFQGQKAPELKGNNLWINTAPLKLEELRGKVVLLHFWAYDCPFCAETAPQIMALYEKYASQGLVIVGVHTPRTDYEKDVAKVKEAVTNKGIRYPVVIDNNYQMWSDYLCASWPSHFVIDQEGVIQLSHTGVGRYDDTEKVIQRLLAGEKSDQ